MSIGAHPEDALLRVVEDVVDAHVALYHLYLKLVGGAEAYQPMCAEGDDDLLVEGYDALYVVSIRQQ